MKHTKLIGLVAAAILVLLYFLVVTPRIYTSEARIVVEKTASAATGSGSLISLMQGGSGFKEARMMKQFIHSSTMLADLDKQFGLRKHYAQPLDPLRSIGSAASTDEALAFYREMVPIQIDEQSGLIAVSVKTFDPVLSQKVLARILMMAEAYMNRAASEVVSGQLSFLKEQVRKAGDDLEKARTDLVTFQDKNKLLTPQDTANTVLGAIGRLEGDLVAKRAELSAALSYLHPQSAEAVRIKSQIRALETQVAAEKGRLVGSGDKARLSASSAQYEKQKMRVEFAADLYKSALSIYEKAQYDAAKKSQTVVLVQPPTLPEEPSYPRPLRDVPIALVIGYLGFLLVSLVVQVVREHR